MSSVNKISENHKERYRKNRQIIQENELASDIHDRLLDDNNLDLAAAFDEAVVWIAELYLEVEKINNHASSGFLRRKPK